jgi:hypothetical protein
VLRFRRRNVQQKIQLQTNMKVTAINHNIERSKLKGVSGERAILDFKIKRPIPQASFNEFIKPFIATLMECTAYARASSRPVVVLLVVVLPVVNLELTVNTVGVATCTIGVVASRSLTQRSVLDNENHGTHSIVRLLLSFAKGGAHLPVGVLLSYFFLSSSLL